MHRIAAAMLIVAAVLAFNGGLLRQAFADQPAVKRAELAPPVSLKSAKVLSLLLVLEALRQEPGALPHQKV